MPLDPEKETEKVTLNPKEGTQKAPSGPTEEAREAPSNREDEAQGTSSDPEEKTLEEPSDPEETKNVAGLTEGTTDFEGLVVPARQKLTISSNLPPNNVKAHVESAGARRRRRSSTAKFSDDERGRRRRERVGVRRRGHGDFSEEGGATENDNNGHVPGTVDRQQAMNALEMEEWRKVRKKKYKLARPNGKLVIGARVIYNIKRLDRTERSKSTDVDLPLKSFG